jgi:hypothetical protein
MALNGGQICSTRTHWTLPDGFIASRQQARISPANIQASTMIGSSWGAIGAAEYRRVQNKPNAELTPYECMVQGVIGIPTDATVLEPLAKARECWSA